MMRNSLMLEFRPPVFWGSGTCRRGVSDVRAAAARALDALVHDFSPLPLFTRVKRRGALFLRLKSSANGVVESAVGLQ